MEHSESIKEVAAALAKAQSKLKAVAKSGKGNYGKYAELAPTLEQVLPITSAEGLAVTQMPVTLEDGTTGMTTLLMHSSGEWISSTFPVRMQKQDPQGQGSAITYARRYALMAVLGIAADDDDGQAGTDGKNPEQSRAQSKSAQKEAPQPKGPARPVDRARITALLRGAGVQDEDMVTVLKEQYYVAEPSQMTDDEAKRVISFLEAKSAADKQPKQEPNE